MLGATAANIAKFKAVCSTPSESRLRELHPGRGYVGVHSASDTEYDWPFYGRLVGAWVLSHPKIQAANPRGAVHVLAVVDESTYSGGMGDHPVSEQPRPPVGRRDQ